MAISILRMTKCSNIVGTHINELATAAYIMRKLCKYVNM